MNLDDTTSIAPGPQCSSRPSCRPRHQLRAGVQHGSGFVTRLGGVPGCQAGRVLAAGRRLVLVDLRAIGYLRVL